ncbi:TIM barrel protein [Paracoccus sp. Z330]|uniref:TIM barrel protein n=1 Tax=Paracoccus onchidii TaxID=3017813 RepID=A0ABT4ZIP6_9RHOB|nr:TIM barrel protein [Paracoccus onchidii]MDB6178868.1 TIM barrel protein [Paracoccus onchidii]
MPRFAANLSMMFTELPITERFAAAADAGFEAVEILFPYDIAANLLSRAAIRSGLEVALLNTPPPNWAGGPRGFAAVPGLEERFQKDFERALRFAQALRARHINVMAGNAYGPEAHEVFRRNLQWATQRAPHASLTIEPVSPEQNPENFLTCFDQAAEIIASVDAPNLGLQLDVFHAQAITADIATTFTKHQALIRHIQVSGYPDRHEPTGNQPELQEFLIMLDQLGYRGFVGAEYEPRGLTTAGLGWLQRAKATAGNPTAP